ncbi:hypothetical protein LshimejAT787_3200070 [Lyophyllum shimeji]|uniref:Uncharacterized protein n=1 Tax=Lyophyllum shimeji TaxID=47721 RepID=A0A9P3UX70_LYOSH|nr:hypothetical protein LshimejAT787_3200070 [Lyophyllum shimeji]
MSNPNPPRPPSPTLNIRFGDIGSTYTGGSFGTTQPLTSSTTSGGNPSATQVKYRQWRPSPLSRPSFMDAYFDNGGNILNCSVRVRRDRSVAYTLSTTKELKGRKVKLLRDEDPCSSSSRGKSECVGFISWREKAVGVFGQRRRVREVRRWRWGWGGASR